MILLPAADQEKVDSILGRLRFVLTSSATPDGCAITASMGTSLCQRGQRITQARHDSDMAMYAQKRQKRSEHAIQHLGRAPR